MAVVSPVEIGNRTSKNEEFLHYGNPAMRGIQKRFPACDPGHARNRVTKSFFSGVFMKSISCLAFVMLMGASLCAAAAPALKKLDQKKIHNEYNDGNFDRVTASLEGFMARNSSYSLEDSVFIAKHLAVVYSANPETREKGKYYMHRLLAILPTAKLIDMYVSDEIDRIFDKVREEFLSRQQAFGVDTAKVSIPNQSPSRKDREQMAAEPGPAREPSEEQPKAVAKSKAKAKDETGIKPAYLIFGSTAVVALSLATYFILSDDPKTTEKTYVVP